MDTEADQTKFDQWAIVELMGHQRIAGKITEESHFGVALMRCDVPAVDGRAGFTKFFGGSVIYAVTPTTEEIATHAAKIIDQAPISRWEMRELLPARTHFSTTADDDADEPDDGFREDDDYGDDFPPEDDDD